MNKSEKFTLAGGAGQMEGVIDYPEAEPRGVALVAHPHPLYGGTMDNKVAVTLMRTFVSLGYVVARINFRGVGKSEGGHDHGQGETDDMALLHAWMSEKYPELPLALAGFSFGTYVQSRLAERLAAAGKPAERLVLVGAAAKKWEMAAIPADTILIHGENDDTIPLVDVLDWLRPQDIPVIVIPGADHFFHRKLGHIKSWVIQLWGGGGLTGAETDTASAD
ncbi:alpha/beta hydrolase [Duganella sp. BuS-21]|uniref:alpha/beta hydrolase n=1 Tax=Duganella sp. BuS-21 TaxID=2943848 RepID=UPI0035A693E3